ncbi:hypothetical protein PoB_005116800 [Plakobranchus ocellatus]|uniref:Uncharacterized protein n=1 Tax=Plakobranchus ocellatus TaxID=259542 RepID=A0AAV4BZR4_9GAST|nr:hypothetical protein PoB_005116800 [Plakobranchus ocellatus]
MEYTLSWIFARKCKWVKYVGPILPEDTVEDDRNLAIFVGQAFKSFFHFTQLLKKREEKLFERLVIGQGSELISYTNQRLKNLKYADCLVYRKVTFR